VTYRVPTSATLISGNYSNTAAFDNALRLTALAIDNGGTTRFKSTSTYYSAGNVATVATTLQAGTGNQAFAMTSRTGCPGRQRMGPSCVAGR
jgi:hypothetical protein